MTIARCRPLRARAVRFPLCPELNGLIIVDAAAADRPPEAFTGRQFRCAFRLFSHCIHKPVSIEIDNCSARPIIGPAAHFG